MAGATPLESPFTDEGLAAHLHEVKARHPSILAYYRILLERGPIAKAALEAELARALNETDGAARLSLVQRWITSGVVRKGRERLDDLTPAGLQIKERYRKAVGAALA